MSQNKLHLIKMHEKYIKYTFFYILGLDRKIRIGVEEIIIN